MKNTLSDLSNYLFESIERINDDSLTGDDLEKEIKRGEMTIKASREIINIANAQLSAIKHIDEYGREKSELPALITGGKGN